MPKNKNAEHRFLILDRCLCDFRHKYTFDDLLEEVNDQLYDANGSKSTIRMRQLRGDLNAIRKMLPDDVELRALPTILSLSDKTSSSRESSTSQKS